MGENAITHDNEAGDGAAERLGLAAFRGTLVAIRSFVSASIVTVMARVFVPHADLVGTFGSVFLGLLLYAATFVVFPARAEFDRRR